MGITYGDHLIDSGYYENSPERESIDYLGDTMPTGYEPWMCPVCGAVCNFEAMTLCRQPPDCGFELDQPESNGGAFGFMKRVAR